MNIDKAGKSHLRYNGITGPIIEEGIRSTNQVKDFMLGRREDVPSDSCVFVAIPPACKIPDSSPELLALSQFRSSPTRLKSMLYELRDQGSEEFLVPQLEQRINKMENDLPVCVSPEAANGLLSQQTRIMLAPPANDPRQTGFDNPNYLSMSYP